MNYRRDPWRLVTAPFTRWHVFPPILLLAALIGGFWGHSTSTHTATVTLLNRHSQPDPSSPASFLAETLLEIAHNPALLERVSESSEFQITAAQIASSTRLVPAGASLKLTVHRRDSDQAIRLANAYAAEIVRRSREIQTLAVESESRLLSDRLDSVDRELARETDNLVRFQRVNNITEVDATTTSYLVQRQKLAQRKEALELELKTTNLQLESILGEITRQNPELVSTREDLARARSHYTDAHPEVKKLLAALAAIEARAAVAAANFQPLPTAAGNNPLTTSLYLQSVELRARQITLTQDLQDLARQAALVEQNLTDLPAKRLEYIRIQSRIESLEQSRLALAQAQAHSQFFVQQTATPWSILQPAALTRPDAQHLATSTSAWQFAGVGFLAAILLSVLLELFDGRIRSEADLKRVTGLPSLARLGDLSAMSIEEKERWGFNTLAALKGRFDLADADALVCGFISSEPGEGRSTWVRMLAEAASKQGHTVLTIFTDETTMTAESIAPDTGDILPPTGTIALNGPRQTALQLAAPSDPADWQVPLPARVWQLRGREQWKCALQEWSSTENLVTLVELPPASRPESVLLSEHIPHLIWLCNRDTAKAKQTEEFVTTLRHARSRLAGTAFNRAATSKKRRWFQFAANALIAVLITATTATLTAQEIPVQPPSPPILDASRDQPDDDPSLPSSGGTLSALSPDHLAEWQKRLTLGSGDVLSVSLYGRPGTTREVTIGPDGRITYLEAQDFTAAGLSVDELRTQLEDLLKVEGFYLSARVVVQPLAFNSKKYYLLGSVNRTGVYPLNRPITIVEAVARAQGFASSVEQRNTLMLADLSRSFLVRQQTNGTFDRVPIDFESLFLRGNLRANQALAPDDYLYFPPLDLQEIYVLGDVGRPGVALYQPGTTALKAIVAGGGFLDTAFKSRVLVVRGSLNNPQTFVVDMNDILSAKEKDFTLQPRDIVYVSRRPWAKAEELLQSALLSFMRGAVVSWTGQNVGPFITSPVF